MASATSCSPSTGLDMSYLSRGGELLTYRHRRKMWRNVGASPTISDPGKCSRSKHEFAGFQGLLVFGAAALSGRLWPSGTARPLQGRWFGESVENFDPADVCSRHGLGARRESGVLRIGAHGCHPRRGLARHYEYRGPPHRGELVLAVRDDKGGAQQTRLSLDGDRYLKWHLDERRSVVLRREQ